MADLREGRILLTEDDIRSKLLEGAEASYIAVCTTYGPRGKNVLVEKGFGRPVLTRDGVTVARDVFFSDRPKNMGAQLLTEAAETTNLIAGDGTTQTVALSYHLLKNGAQAIAAGKHPMEISDTIAEDSRVILKKLKELAIPVEDEQLEDVASVSAGDPLIGQLIAEAIIHVGQDGGILTEKSPITEVEREYVDGYYLQSGFTALVGGKKELAEPYVVISSKRLSSSVDAIEILNGIMAAKGLQKGQIPKVLFIGNIEDSAYTTIVNTINAGQIDAVIIKTPPMYGELGKFLLEDIAVYAGCQVITDNTPLKDFVIVRDGKPRSSFIGTVDKVIASKDESTLFADNQTETVLDRITEIKEQLETETTDAVAEKLRDRIAKLEGKIALFRIGGVNDTAKEELEFRIEDAINSTRHAYNEGIVAGGGVTLLELSKSDISDMTRNALQSTFQQLLVNANLPSESKLGEALKAPKGYGFNLRKSDKLVDVIKEGIVDPYVVTREVVKNSLGTVEKAITVGAALVFENTQKE